MGAWVHGCMGVWLFGCVYGELRLHSGSAAYSKVYHFVTRPSCFRGSIDVGRGWITIDIHLDIHIHGLLYVMYHYAE